AFIGASAVVTAVGAAFTVQIIDIVGPRSVALVVAAVGCSACGFVLAALMLGHDALVAARGRTPWARVLIWWLGLLIVLTTGVVLMPVLGDSEQLTATEVSFLLLVFVGTLPLLNALLDWISVGLTRRFIRGYLDRSRNFFWFLALDGITAVLLTVA